MIRPLRLTTPWDSLPLSSQQFAATAIVRNGASGLNIPNSTQVQAPTLPGQDTPYNMTDFVLCQGFDVFSLVLSVDRELQVVCVPRSAINPAQELDEIPWGSVLAGGYYRVSIEQPGLFGFHLRFRCIGPSNTVINEVLELRLTKR